MQLTCHGQVPSHSSAITPRHSRPHRQKIQTWGREEKTSQSNPQTDTVSLSVIFQSGIGIKQVIITTSEKAQQNHTKVKLDNLQPPWH